MVRNSSGHDAQQPFTLVVFYNSRVYNIPVRYISMAQQYALGREKKGEEVQWTSPFSHSHSASGKTEITRVHQFVSSIIQKNIFHLRVGL